MKHSPKIIILISSLSIVISSDYVGYGSFVSNSNSARAIALSYANTGWVNDMGSVYSNPAGLASMEGLGFNVGRSVSNSSFLNDLKYRSVSIGYSQQIVSIPWIQIVNPEIFMAIGFGLQDFTVDDIDEYDKFENYQSTFNFSEMAINLLTSLRIYSLSLGMKWTYYSQDFGSYGYVHSNKEDLQSKFYRPTELGMQYRITKNYMIGFIYDKSTQIGNYDITPARLKVGFSYNNNNINYGLDYERQSTDKGRIMTGLEYIQDIYDIPISFRIGGRGNVINDSIGWEIKDSFYITSGIGIQLDLFNDYTSNISIALNQSAYPNILSPLFRIMYISFDIY